MINRTMVILFVSFISTVIIFKTSSGLYAADQEAAKEPGRIEYKSEGLRDPFQEEDKIEIKEEPKAEAEAKPLPPMQIQGIVWGGSFPQAIINNRVVIIGDTLEGVRITDINKNGVTLFFGNQQYNLSTSSPVSSQGAGQGPNKNNPQGGTNEK